MLVHLACSEAVVDGDGRRYTNMYETKNETNCRPATCGERHVQTVWPTASEAESRMGLPAPPGGECEIGRTPAELTSATTAARS